MTTRRAVLLAGLALLGGVLVAVPRTPDLLAQERRRGDRKGGDDDGGDEEEEKDKEKEKEKTPEEKELAAIGKDFEEKDVDALIARVPEDIGGGKQGRIRLRLGSDDGTFARTQAKGIIEKWLESRTITKVRLKSTKDLTGTFVLKWRRRQKDDEVEATLLVRIARGDDDAFVLKELEVRRR